MNLKHFVIVSRISFGFLAFISIVSTEIWQSGECYLYASRHSGRGSGNKESNMSQQFPWCIGLESPILAKRMGLSSICCSTKAPNKMSRRRGRCLRLASCVANESMNLFQSRSTKGRLGKTSPELNVSDARTALGKKRKLNWTDVILQPQTERVASPGYAKTESPPIELGCK
jgi:hypothetical protein